MCCGDEDMHKGHGGHGSHHEGMDNGMCGCSCGERRFLSRKEKIEMLEEYIDSLKNELEGAEEALKELKKDK
jgi:hypothetical protein